MKTATAIIPVAIAGGVAVVARIAEKTRARKPSLDLSGALDHLHFNKNEERQEAYRQSLEADVARINSENEENGHSLRWSVELIDGNYIAKPNM